MGSAKRLWEEEQSRGYSLFANTFVCSDCLNEQGIKEFIERNSNANQCTYCGSNGSTLKSINLNKVVEHVLDSLKTEYGNPANEGLAYETAEGGWQGDVHNTYELLYDLIDIDNTRIIDDIAGSILESEWCELDPYGLSKDRALWFGWEKFSSFIVNKSRYLFSLSTDSVYTGSERDSYITPSEILNALGRISKNMGLVHTISKATDIYRVRVFDPGARSESAKDLGSPPAKFAKIPNRMSPAGIPMFYGAFDVKTAALETFTANEKDKEAIAGVFRCTRDLTILNLSAGRYLPSIFDSEDRHKRTSAKFLIDFIIDFSKPIDREDRAHIDYVPTQVVTEYFRHIFKLDDGTTLDGIIYPSSKKGGNNAIVIFAESSVCVEKSEKDNRQALLWLRKTVQIDLSSINKKGIKLS
jgi:hypothetical protein